MPENASTRTTDRDRLRSRLVSPRSAGRGATAGAPPAAVAPHAGAARGRPAHFEQSPVLFRLPSIAPAELHDSELDAFAAAIQPPQNQPPGSPQGELRSDDEGTLDIVDIEPHTPFHASGQSSLSQLQSSQSQSSQIPLSRSPISPTQTSQSAFSSSSFNQPLPSQKNAAEVASRLQPAGAVDLPQVEAAPVAEAACVAEANSEPKRTWWEHWSSGVVLILLVIALVVASIIAFNDSGSVNSDQLAGQLDGLTLDEFDLSSIAIPDISMPPLGGSADRSLSSVTPSSSTAGDAASSVAAAPTSSPPAPMSAPPTPIAAPAASESASVASAAADTTASQTPVAEQATPQPQAIPAQTAGESTGAVGLAEAAAAGSGSPPNLAGLADGAGQAAVEAAVQATAESNLPLPLATLDRPTEVATPRLFPAAELTGAVQGNTGSLGISSLPVSNPTASLELPGGAAVPAEGSSPTFYDGASRAGEQQTASGSSMSAAAGELMATASQAAQAAAIQGPVTSAAGPVDTNMPRIPAVLASATTGTGLGDASAGQVVASATPDFNGESIVEAYLRFKRINQAASGSASNRYPDPPPAN